MGVWVCVVDVFVWVGVWVCEVEWWVSGCVGMCGGCVWVGVGVGVHHCNCTREMLAAGKHGGSISCT